MGNDAAFVRVRGSFLPQINFYAYELSYVRFIQVNFAVGNSMEHIFVVYHDGGLKWALKFDTILGISSLCVGASIVVV